MSAYLNLGMVSPFRLARDAVSVSPKYINEMQVWRELSYTFCFHHPDSHASLAGLPAWAQRALRERPQPPPAACVSLQALSACASGAPLWDALQRSLRDAGELHNNARMTWAKQLLGWSASGEEALAKLVYLNDHFALDGQAPPSYGGLMWALGLFSGGPNISTRPLSGQAGRLDVVKLDTRTAALARA
jgi:deoxyribodipyrimidine photolyase